MKGIEATPSRSHIALIPLLGLLILAGCRASGTGWSPTPEPREAGPTWLHEEDSWDRLDSIETWLDGPGTRARPELVPEAELILAEGRLSFARHDSDFLPERNLRWRLDSAEQGFERVLGHPLSTSAQRQRAHGGLATLRLLAEGLDTDTSGKLVIHSRGEWGASAPNPGRLTPHRGRYERITIHHSTIPVGARGCASLAESADAVRDIQRVHMRDRDYGDIGYHFLIGPSGRLFAGRSMKIRGAHASGANNIGNVGICLLGNFENARPTPAALSTLQKLVGALMERHGISRSRIYGHQEMRATKCPGRFLMSWVQRFRGGLALR